MPFQYLTNMPLDEAVAALLDALDRSGMKPQQETVAVQEALGRTTAEPVYAAISAPHYHACAMDGIALAASLTFGASATTPVSVPAGSYTVVDTGDVLPSDCDAIVMIENVIVDDNAALGTCSVKLLEPVVPWENVRQIGEDVCAGEMLATSGKKLSAADLGAMLAAGVGTVPVHRRPTVGIIPTGDEVVPPSANPEPGDVMEFNSTIFSGMVEQWGGSAHAYPIVADNKDALRAAMKQALNECDIVLLNAGSSAGRDDYASEIIAEFAEVTCHGLAIKPGKPAILAHAGAKPVLGIPGYPVSGIVVIEEVVRPIMKKLGCTIEDPEYADVRLSRPLNSSLKYQEYVRVRMGKVGDEIVASPLPRAAGVVTSFTKADGMLVVEQNSEGMQGGAAAHVRLLQPLSTIERAVVVTGSHDPLIDELAQIVHQADPAITLASTHVGSMGAIMAAKRAENHCGGIHLLDEQTGTYNTPYLEQHFPNGGVRLVECVHRKQGFMVAPGNPHGIAGMADLANGQLRYVNRQKGSGTRILADYVCRQEDIDPGAIYGYDHEEFTHTAVATLVAAGSADAGMGIYSAAKMYGLDFVEVCEEQYDLVVPDYAWETPGIQALMAALASPAFAARIEAMGGYRIENPGTVRRHFS